jgi:hypothetical protein
MLHENHPPLPWLLEPDNPSARYLALTELLDRPLDAPDVKAARAAIPTVDPVRAILEAQFKDAEPGVKSGGYWIKPDLGYSPKYRATVWQVIFLAQLGAPPTEPIRNACNYVLDHSRRLKDRQGNPDGRFVVGGGARAAVDCLNGNLLWALGRLGHGDDPRTVEAREATAQTIVERGFGCYYNSDLPCAWGDVKALKSFVEVPIEKRSAAVREAIELGVEFLLSVPLLEATYPMATQVSPRWFKLGFPLGFRSDVLEALTVLAGAGQGSHPQVGAGAEWLLAKQDPEGRWLLKDLPGKMWASVGQLGAPNKWLTLRALSFLKAVGRWP